MSENMLRPFKTTHLEVSYMNHLNSRRFSYLKTRRRMARERRGAGSSLVSVETQYYKQYIKDVV